MASSVLPNRNHRADCHVYIVLKLFYEWDAPLCKVSPEESRHFWHHFRRLLLKGKEVVKRKNLLFKNVTCYPCLVFPSIALLGFEAFTVLRPKPIFVQNVYTFLNCHVSKLYVYWLINQHVLRVANLLFSNVPNNIHYTFLNKYCHTTFTVLLWKAPLLLLPQKFAWPHCYQRVKNDQDGECSNGMLFLTSFAEIG